MEKFRNKYEIILGFVTLVISFSAFKDELAKVRLPLGYATISLADYFWCIVCAFSFCLYLYILESIFRDMKIGKWKDWVWVVRVAYTSFVFVLLTPLLLSINIGVYRVVDMFSNLSDQLKLTISIVLNSLLSLLLLIIAILTALKTFFQLKLKQIEVYKDQEILELENSNKLLQDGYYSHSILESFKVLETYLKKELTKRNIRLQRSNFNELLQTAIRENIVNPNHIPIINDIRGMRNLAAHASAGHTQGQAEIALEFVRGLLKNDE